MTSESGKQPARSHKPTSKVVKRATKRFPVAFFRPPASVLTDDRESDVWDEEIFAKLVKVLNLPNPST